MNKEGKLTSNKEFVDEMKEFVDKMMSQMFGDMVTLTGATFNELDPEQVRIFNKYMRMYNDLWKMYADWAEYQDSVINKQKIAHQTMCGMIEQNRQVLTEVNSKIDLMIDASDRDRLEQLAHDNKKNKKE